MQLAQQLEQALCSQPFSQLGVLEDKGEYLLRVYRPDAKSVTVKWESAALADVTLQSNGGGLYEGRISQLQAKTLYRVLSTVTTRNSIMSILINLLTMPFMLFIISMLVPQTCINKLVHS